jgi:hypothetical protein
MGVMTWIPSSQIPSTKPAIAIQFLANAQELFSSNHDDGPF